jgi:AcrR family transcriptional regulator
MAGGRPRVFDVEEAVGRALDVFWSKGFEAASLSDLLDAMGIKVSSFYAAFGSKEALFFRALDLYMARVGGYAVEAVRQPTAVKVVEGMLYGAIAALTGNGRPSGCLTVQGALAPSSTTESVRKSLERIRESGYEMLHERLERARAEGDLPAEADPKVLARLVSTLVHGIAVQAVSGAAAQELEKAAAVAVRCWDQLARSSGHV